jgi:hypothetical protein
MPNPEPMVPCEQTPLATKVQIFLGASLGFPLVVFASVAFFPPLILPVVGVATGLFYAGKHYGRSKKRR